MTISPRTYCQRPTFFMVENHARFPANLCTVWQNITLSQYFFATKSCNTTLQPPDNQYQFDLSPLLAFGVSKHHTDKKRRQKNRFANFFDMP